MSDAEKAEKIKSEANEEFKKQKFEEAINLYTKAIELNNEIAVYFGNRSFAYLKMELFGYALTDATKAIELDRTYTKGYYRRATCHMALGKFKLALRDYEAVSKARPNDKDAKMKYQECKNIVKRQAFEKAISVDECVISIADSINLDQMEIDDSYTGPALKDDKVTLNFIKELMESYKNQKKLHKKYAYKILIDVKAYFKEQPSLVDISVADDQKFTICGDIHGQFYDLMNIFELNGLPSPENPYVSLQIIFYLITKLIFVCFQ
ncbi:Serine/threonine-protein phosphatase 5 [Nymphon striatum]|nr:Serine/threonine-protein phosphatase 5 [Nymphon striatum]